MTKGFDFIDIYRDWYVIKRFDGHEFFEILLITKRFSSPAILVVTIPDLNLDLITGCEFISQARQHL